MIGVISYENLTIFEHRTGQGDPSPLSAPTDRQHQKKSG